MLHQIETRIFGIFIIQPIVILIFTYIVIRILKRNRNLLTITLSAFYILIVAGFIFNIFFIMGTLLPVELALIPSILYFISSFLVIFSPIFLVIFLFLIKRQDFSSKSYILLTSFYGLGCLLIILLIPGGIDVGIHTNWIPKYSWMFLIIFYIFFSLIIVIPTIYLLTKLLMSFQDRDLRKKFFIFLIGIFSMLVIFYGLVLYNTWHDPTFRVIWSIVSLIVIPAGLLIYNGIGQNL